jgi:uncharacterized protein (DUF488 family)
MRPEPDPEQQRQIYTVGHSNHLFEVFLDLLRTHSIEVLVDVRSAPFSKYAPQFDKRALEQAISTRGITYTYLGQELGGRPRGDQFYDAAGHVVYSLVEEAPFFQRGLSRLEAGIEQHRVAIMCSEEDPAGCHRRLLVGRVLANKGVELLHIRGDGRIEREDRVRATGEPDGQLELFPEEQVREWKSIRSVSPKGPRPTSSEP